MSKVYIIIVNWNGWQDTIECLESVFRLKYDDFCVILCDNGSTNDSVGHIARWAGGGLPAHSENAILRPLICPPYPKPIPFAIVDPAECTNVRGRSERLFLAPIGKNIGFAGGNNVGLRIALASEDLEYAWLLNNDTVVHPDALTHLVARMKEKDEVGMCGSTVVYYDDAKTVQAAGGAGYNRWTARVTHIGCDRTVESLPSRKQVEQQMEYVLGASMLVSLSFLLHVGLMNEQYFLFFEEIDWSTRGRNRFRLGYSPASIVYHKQGRSTGESQTLPKHLNTVGGGYGPRNRILFTRTHHPLAVLTVVPAVLASILYRVVTGRASTVRTLLSGAIAGITEPVRIQNGH